MRLTSSRISIVLALVLAGCAPAEKPLVTVGSQTVTEADFVQAAESSQGQYGLDPTVATPALMRDLTNRALMLELAHRLGQDTTLALANMTRDTEKRNLVQQVLLTDASAQQRVSEAEAQALYEARRVEGHVWLLFATSEEAAKGAMTRIQQGETFERVANGMNVGGMLPANGDMEWVAPGALPDPLDAGVRTLAIGALGGPYRTREGWFVMRVTERRKREQGTYEATRDGLLDLARQRKQRAAFNHMYESLKAAYEYQAAPGASQLLFRITSPVDPIVPTATQRATPLATWFDGHRRITYTLQDALDDLRDANVQRPPSQSQPAMDIWIEQQVMTRAVVAEAKRRHYHEEPGIANKLRVEREKLLLDGVYQWAMRPVPPPSEAMIQSAFEQVRDRFAKVTRVHVSSVTIVDSSKVLALLKALQSNRVLADAAHAVDASLVVEDVTVQDPANDASWSAMAGMFSQMPTGGIGGPEQTAQGWRVVQLLDKEVATPTFAQLPEAMQQNLRSNAFEMLAEQRFQQVADSLAQAYQPFIDTEAIKRLRWPGGAGAAPIRR